MANTEPDFYEQVYGRDNPEGESHGWIQWKGTNVCMDLHCSCGHHGHFDGDFFYHFQCPACGKKFAVGQNVALIPLTDEEVAHLESEGRDFKTCELDEDEFEES